MIFVSFFCGIVKLICELQHTVFINLRLWQRLNLRHSALFYKNLRSPTGTFAHSAVCGNIYAPLFIGYNVISKSTLLDIVCGLPKGIHSWNLAILALYKRFSSSIKIIRPYNVCWWYELILFGERYPLAFWHCK